MIGLVLPLLLPTPIIWFSLDHKRNVSEGAVNGIGTLFSLDHKLYASDYDSDSVASEITNLKYFSDSVLRGQFLNSRGWPLYTGSNVFPIQRLSLKQSIFHP